MNKVLVLGDGPLAYELIELLEAHDQAMAVYVWGEEGPGHDPLEGLGDTLNRVGGDVTTVIEAIIADRVTKRKALEIVDQTLLRKDVLLLPAVLNATTTEVNSWIRRTDYVAGWAMLPPLESGKLVEVFSGIGTEERALQSAKDFFAGLGKEAVEVEDTLAGVVPRVVASLINNAAYTALDRVATPEDIDKAMKLGTNYPHGPLEWADLIGIDQVVGILTALAEAYEPARYIPAENLRQMDAGGRWGKRTGQGFYRHDGQAG